MFATSFLFIDCGFIIPQDKVFFCDEVTLIKNPVLLEHRIFLYGHIFLFQTMESICIAQRNRTAS